jgi:hypothetical protein
MSDPSRFITTVHSIWGLRNNKEQLKRELAAIQKQMESLKPKRQLPIRYVAEAEFLAVPTPATIAKTTAVIPLEREITPVTILPPRLPSQAEPDYAMMQTFAQIAAVSELTQIKQKLAKEEFNGELDPRTLSATDTLQWLDLLEEWPHKAWISAYLINDGANSVQITTNNWPTRRHTIKKDETLTLNQEHADRRISRLFYVCATGETATVRVVGQY